MNRLKPDSIKKNIGYLFGAETITKILSFLSFLLIAKSFSMQDYGIFALAFSVGSFFYIFFNFGLEYHLIRDIKKAKLELKDIVSTVMNIKIWSSPVFIFIFFMVYSLMRWDWVYLHIIFFMFLYFYFYSALTLLFFFFRAYEKMKYEFVGRTVHGFVLFACVFLFGYLKKDLFTLTLSYSFITLIFLFLFFIFFSKKLEIKIFEKPMIRKEEFVMIGESKYLFLTNICTSIFSSVDIWIISVVLGLSAVAIYKNAILITLALFMFPTVLMQGFYPHLVHYRLESIFFWKKIMKILKITLLSSVSVSVILFIFAPFIIVHLFGEKYFASIYLFRISLMSFIFASINQVFGFSMFAIGKYKPYFLITLAVSICSILLNLVLIPQWGLIGGIITMNTTHFLLVILPLMVLRYKRDRIVLNPSLSMKTTL